jgi:hypothetical protein
VAEFLDRLGLDDITLAAMTPAALWSSRVLRATVTSLAVTWRPVVFQRPFAARRPD